MIRHEALLASIFTLLLTVGLIIPLLNPQVVEAASTDVFTVSQSVLTCSAYFDNGTLFYSSRDSSAVVSRINSYLSRGGKVFFKNGTYVAYHHWQITHQNIVLTAGAGVVVDFRYPIPDNKDESSSGILIAASNVSVKGFTIKNCSKSGIKARAVSNIQVANNQILNAWTGITFESVNDSVIDSNIVSRTQGDGIYITGYYPTNDNSKNITVRNNEVYFVGDTGIDVSNGDSNIEFSSVTVKNNNIKRFNNATLTPTPIGAGIIIGNGVSNFLVADTIVDSMNFSLQANGASGVITNNTLTNFQLGSGIWGTASSNVMVTNNNIYSSSQSTSNAIYTNKAWTIRDNKITVNGASGNSAVNAVTATKTNNTNYVVTVSTNSIWYGTGEDWALSNEPQYHSTWMNYLDSNFSNWNFNTVKLAFSTEYVGERQTGLLNLTELNSLLDILDGHGLKAILDCQGGVFNNARWWSQWRNIINRFGSDTRILGWELIDEPPTSNITGNPVKVNSISSQTDILNSLNAMTRWIKQEDTIHYIIYPAGYIPKNSAIAKGMVLDFHFWDYGNQNTTQQIDNQIAYRMSQLHAWDERGYKYWLGEVGPQGADVGGCQNVTLEKYYVEQMINNVTEIGSGFSIWLYSNNHLMIDRGVTYDDILGNLNYNKKPPTFSLADLVALSKAYRSTPGDPNWNPTYDLNHDSVINLADLAILVYCYR